MKLTRPEVLIKIGCSIEQLAAYAESITDFISQHMKTPKATLREGKPMHSDFKSVSKEALKEPENGNGGDPEKKGKKKRK